MSSEPLPFVCSMCVFVHAFLNLTCRGKTATMFVQVFETVDYIILPSTYLGALKFLQKVYLCMKSVVSKL